MFLGDWYFAYGSYLCTNFGTHDVLVFISVSTYAQAQVVCAHLWYFAFGSYQFKKLGRMFLGGWYFAYGLYLCTNFGTQGVLVFISVSTYAQAQVERI